MTRRARVDVALLAFAALTLPNASATQSPIGQGEDGNDTGKRVFTQAAQPACSVCHTLADAGATGKIGPNLDEMRPSAEQVMRAVRQGIGAMPAFEDTLSKAQIEAVARYVERAASH
jgi:mono/diheme cytochrome c family protein